MLLQGAVLADAVATEVHLLPQLSLLAMGYVCHRGTANGPEV